VSTTAPGADRLSTEPGDGDPESRGTRSWVWIVALMLCAAGLAAATYLTIAHYSAAVVLACPETGVVNCAKVTTSRQSMILGIPVALLGLLYFAAVTPLHLPAAWRSSWALLRRVRVLAAVTGILMVLYLVYTELFTLDAICLWCTAVHVITFLLFAVTLIGTSETASAGT